MLDGADWHLAGDLVVADNITLPPPPPRAPELNPVENMWQFLRDNWLGNRVFTSYDDIVDRCCEAWNRLTDQPWEIMSIGLRDWAHRSSSAYVGIRRRELGARPGLEPDDFGHRLAQPEGTRGDLWGTWRRQLSVSGSIGLQYRHGRQSGSFTPIVDLFSGITDDPKLSYIAVDAREKGRVGRCLNGGGLA